MIQKTVVGLANNMRIWLANTLRGVGRTRAWCPLCCGGYDADVRNEEGRSMSIRQQAREDWRVPLSGHREQEFSASTFLWVGCRQLNGRQRIFNEPCSAFG